MRLLLIEDEIPLAEILAEALEESGYIVDVVHDGESGWHQATEETYSIILLDWMLPKVDGVQLCQRLRSAGHRVPILMITARDASTDKVMGLDAGADDYIVKPINLAELLARIRAALRREQPTPTNVLCWGALSLHPEKHEVTYDQKQIILTPKEFSLLELFLRSGQRVLSRHVIINHLWHLDDSPGEEAVKAHIKGLRKKLSTAGAPTYFIETVRGVGYRLGSV